MHLDKVNFLFREREQPPRFARMGSFEFEYGRKWQQMYLHHQSEEENLKRQFEENVSKLELDMANGYMEHQTQMLREGNTSFFYSTIFVCSTS